MRRTWTTIMMTLAAMLLPASHAHGQVTPIGPFTGTFFDDFNNTGAGGGGNHPQVDVFGGFCTVRVVNTGALKIEFSSERGGDLAFPKSPPVMFGQICISEWTFDAPIFRYGGYWENNSRFDDATVEFFDANNNLIASVNAPVPKAAQTWTWNGWESTVPFTKVRVTGNDAGFLNGFIWWEDFNITVAAVPEPGTYALLAVTGAVGVGVYYLRRKRAEKSLDLV